MINETRVPDTHNQSQRHGHPKMSEDKKQEKKEKSKKGERSQKMVSFRCDNDVLEWLNSQPNKGRYLNGLIRLDKASYGF